MTSPPSPLNRRRRRIVVAVTVLAVGLCWWISPRVDQRFVGKWELFDEDGLQLDESWTVQSNGFARVSTHPSDPTGHEYFLWAVDSKQFVMGNDLNRWSVIVGPITNIYNNLSDSTFHYGLGAQHFEIVGIAPHEIVLNQSGRKTTLRRVAE